MYPAVGRISYGMKTMRIRNFALLAGFVLALGFPVAAHAYASVITGAVNLRSGAGVSHARITTLPRGTAVWVDHCRKNWCLVRARGLNGWVSARYLSGAGAVRRYYPPAIYVPPVIGFGFVVPRSYHDYGYGRHHKPKRKFHKKSNRVHGRRKKWSGGCPPWKCDK